jgi:LuxR family transcriptional regulator, maltose regulon positive regulatory protein
VPLRAGDRALQDERAFSLALTPGDARRRMDAGWQLAFRGAFWGTDLVRARIVLETLLPIATAPGVDSVERLTWHAVEASYHAHLGNAAAARQASDQGLETAAESGLHHLDSVLLSARVLGALANDDIRLARRELPRLAAAAHAGAPFDAFSYQYTASLVAYRDDEVLEARERARVAAQLAEEEEDPLALAAATVVWAAAAARGGGDGPTLAEAARFAGEVGAELAEMSALLLSATTALRHELEHEAAELLRDALASARRLGAMHCPCVSRAGMAELCALALERGLEPQIAERIVRARRLAPCPRARPLARWPWAVRVRALGGLDVWCDAGEVPHAKEQKKPLELLRLLVVHGERGAPMESLAEALWPDADGDAGHRALETTMYRLRRLIRDPAAVVRRGGRASLDPDRVFVDAWAVESLAASAEALHARGEHAQAIRAASAAVELYRGDLLADDDLRGLPAARARLRERVLRLSGLRAA